jgi:hypothetical protein
MMIAEHPGNTGERRAVDPTMQRIGNADSSRSAGAGP